MNINIKDKVVVITGATGGIGSELSKKLAKEQSKVVINYYKNEEKAIELYKEISFYNKNCKLIRADITNQNQVLNLFKEVIKTFGKIDVLINNAGVCDDQLLSIMTYDSWKKVLDVNLNGTFLCCKICSRIMIRQNYGKIINIASIKGLEGCVGQSNYSASKAGIIGLTKTMAKELGVFNIEVNAINPNFIVTGLNKKNKIKEEVAKKRSVLNYKYGLNDLVNFIILLSSNKCNGVSGQVFNIDSRLFN